MTAICKQFSDILPENLRLVVHSFEDFTLLFPELKNTTTREKEFLLGRYCATKALESFGLEEPSVGQKESGSPQWPEGFVGSISHSKGLVLSVVGRSDNYLSIGVDLEKVNRLKAQTIDRIVHEYETAFVQMDRKKASILFSLKEAFYKAQSPIFNGQLNFKDVAMHMDIKRGRASIQWVSDKIKPPEQGYENWKCSFKLIDEYVFAICLFEKY